MWGLKHCKRRTQEFSVSRKWQNGGSHAYNAQNTYESEGYLCEMVEPSRKIILKKAANRRNIHCRRGRVIFSSYLAVNHGPGSSVGIATDYGLDGPGSNSGGDEIFRPSRPALGSTQSPVKWVPGLSRG